MKIEGIALLINKWIKDQNYVKARDMIQKEWTRIIDNKNYQMLSDEAKQFVKMIKDENGNKDLFSLTDKEKQTLNLLNQSIRNLKLSFAKRLFNQHHSLLQNPVAQKWLTSEARFVCQSWNKNN